MEDFFENELVKKFEEMIDNHDELYFDTEEYEDIIVYYLEMGDITYAEMAVSFALKLHPNSLELKVKQLEVFLELEQYQKSKELIDMLEVSSTESTDFLVCCAKYYSNLGNPRKSIEYCEKALQLNEEQNFLHNFIGDEYHNLDDPFNALKNYKLALTFDPQDDYSLENAVLCLNEMKRSEEAIDFLNNYLDQYPYSEAAWYEYGQIHFNKKNYEEAIKAFDYILAINSESTGVYSNKAACYEAMTQWEKAIKVYEELLELEYTKAFTYYKIGLCYKEEKRLIFALNAFQKSLREDPQFYLSMMEQSDVYLEMGKKLEALHFAKEALALSENNMDYQKKVAFLSIDNGNFEESLPYMKNIIEAEPNRFYGWYAYSEVLMIVGKYLEAVAVLQKAITIHHRAELFYQLSNCWFNLNEESKSKEQLKIALDLDPSLAKDMQQKYPFISDDDLKLRAKKT